MKGLDFSPETMREWSENRHVAVDVLEVGTRHYLVSTIRLPFDHGWEDEKTLWYETMIFDCDRDGNLPPVGEGSRDHWQSRYTTQQEAQTGHDWLVQAILHWDDKWDVIEDQWRNR